MSIQEKLTTITENVPRVYEAGVAEGRTQEWSDFWDVVQRNGTKTVYSSSFIGYIFSFDNFYPKYDIKAEGSAERMFYYWGGDDSTLPNQTGSLKARLEECGVVLDTSKATNLNYAFGYCQFTELPTIDLTGVNGVVSSLFRGDGALTFIEKIIVNENVGYSMLFAGANNVAHAIFEGTIAQNGLDTGYLTKLDKNSIISIINCLSSTTSGLSVIISKTAVNKAFATTEGGTDGSTSAEWQALVATKPNWTIVL